MDLSFVPLCGILSETFCFYYASDLSLFKGLLKIIKLKKNLLT